MSTTEMLRRAAATAAVLATAVLGLAAPAQADSAPANPARPDEQATVTADALPTVQIDGVVWSQVVVGNTVYVAGSFSSARPAGAAPGTNEVPRSNILAYDIRTGVLDPSFAPVLDGQALAITASPDGSRVYVTGDFNKVDGQWRVRIAAFDTATKQLVAGFRPTLASRGLALAATADTVYVGGNFTSVAPVTGATLQPRAYAAAFDATNGSLRPFVADASAPVTAVARQVDGQRVILGGRFATVNGVDAYGLAAVDPATGATLAYPASAKIRNAGANSAVLSLLADETGVYGTGYHFGTGGNLEGAFRADPVTGEIVWIADCHGDTYSATRMGDVLYTVGHSHYCGNIPDGFPQTEPWSFNHLVALTLGTAGTNTPDIYGYAHSAGEPAPRVLHLNPQFYTGSFTGQGQAGWSVASNSDYVTMGGEFPGVNGQPQQGLVRFARSSTAPNSQGPRLSGADWNVRATSTAAGEVRVSWAPNFDRDNETLTYRVYRGTTGSTPLLVRTVTTKFWQDSAFGFTDVGRVPGSTASYVVTATDPFGNRATSSTVSTTVSATGQTGGYESAVRADEPDHHWRLGEESGSASADVAGFSPLTTVGSGVTRGDVGAVGDADTATTFPGTTSSFATTGARTNAPDAFTVEAWVRTSTTRGGGIVSFGNSSTGLSAAATSDRTLYLDNSGRVNFGIYSGSRVSLRSAAAVNDNQWHQVVGTYQDGVMRLYVDGVRVAQRTDVSWVRPYWGGWRVGGDRLSNFANAPASNYLAASIDEVAVYGTALSGDRVRAHFTASGRAAAVVPAPADVYGSTVRDADPDLYWRLGDQVGSTAADAGAYGQTGVYRSGVTLGAAGAVSGTSNTAAAFNGINGLVSSAQTWTNPTVFSEELWFRTTTTAGGKLIGFGSSATGTSSSYDRHVYMETSGRLTFGVYSGSTVAITSPAAYNDGGWHHMVATLSPAGMRLYVDGALVAQGSQTAAQDYTGYWRVGGDTTWGPQPWFAGTIDEVAVYSYALDADRVALHHSIGTTGAAPNVAPAAAITSVQDDLTVDVDGTTSTDADGVVTAWVWDFGDGATATGATASHTYAAAGTYTVTLTVTDDRGATATATREVTVVPNQAPLPGFSADVASLDLEVDASSSVDPDGTVEDWAWDFGDGATATGVTAEHTYATAGTYMVTLTVADDDGATATSAQQVTATDPPAELVLDRFTRTSVNGWGQAEVGGAWSLTGTASSFSVADGAGRQTLAAGATRRAALPAATSTGTEVRVSVQLDKAQTGGGTYVSVVGRQVGTQLGYSARLRYLATGQVQLAAMRDGAALQTVTVPGVSATAGAKTQVRLEVSGTSPTTVRARAWADGSPEPSAWQVSVTDDTAAGQAAGWVELSSYLSGSATNAPVTVTFDDLVAGAPGALVEPEAVVPNVGPVAQIAATVDGLGVSLDGAGSSDPDGDVTAWAWDLGDGATATGATATHTYAAAGTYAVTLTVTDDDGATASTTRQVTVASAEGPAALVADAFGRDVTAGWGAADTGGSWTTAGAGSLFGVSDGAGRVSLAAGATPRLRVDSTAVLDADVSGTVALDRLSNTGVTTVWLAGRSSGWTSQYELSLRLAANGSTTAQVVRRLAGGTTVLGSAALPGITYAPGDVLHLRLQMEGSGSTALRARVWRAGQPEPTAWTVQAVDDTPELQDGGGIGAGQYTAASTSNGPLTVTWDDIVVTPLGQP